MLSFFGTELSRRVRSHSQASLQASLGMRPDEPGQLSLRTIGAVVHGGSTIFCAGSPTGVRDVQRDLVFPVDFYILNGQIGHKKGISAKHWYVTSF